MSMLCVTFGFKIRHKTFGCVSMGGAVLFLGPDCSYIQHGLE